MSEPVHGVSRKALIDELMARGYRPQEVPLVAVADLILAGTDAAHILSILEPAFARAYSTRAWLDAGPTFVIGAPAEIAERGEQHPPHHPFEDQLRNHKERT